MKAKVLAHLLLFGSTYLIFMIIGLFFLRFHRASVMDDSLGWLLITLSSFTSLAIDYSRLDWNGNYLNSREAEHERNVGMNRLAYHDSDIRGNHVCVAHRPWPACYNRRNIACGGVGTHLIPAWKVVVKAAGVVMPLLIKNGRDRYQINLD